MKIKLTIFLLFCASTGVFSQTTNKNSGKLAITTNKRTVSFGIRLNSQGYGAFADFGKQMTLSKRKFYEVEITEIRHPKQTKKSPVISSSSFSDAKSYFYGKQNTFMIIRGGMGFRKVIGEKAEKSGVEVAWSYFGGVSLGLLKPYYINVMVPEGNNGDVTLREIKYSDETSELFLNEISIYGSAGFTKGLGEIKILPGLHGKITMHFDWGRDDDAIKELQIGFSLDAYLNKVPIMILENNHQLFPQFFAGFSFGRVK